MTTRTRQKRLLEKVPARVMRTAEAYYVAGMKPMQIAAEHGITVRTVYHRLRIIERFSGKPAAHRTKRGRPRGPVKKAA